MFHRIKEFCKRHSTALGYVYVTVLFVVALGVIQHNAHEATHKNCVSIQISRQSLRDVILVSTSQSASLDLTKVPGFNDLDTATQQFFRNLSPVPDGTKIPTDLRGIPLPDPNNKLQVALLVSAPPVIC